MRQDRATVLLIAPWWPKRTWFLEMITLVVGYPRTLPVRRDVISQPISGTLHPRPSALHLTAWPLSGRPELRQAFLKGLRPDRVRAHDTRSVSSSWALFNGASLKEIQQAAFWSNPNSFVSCYLKDVVVGEASFAAAVLKSSVSGSSGSGPTRRIP